MVVLKIMAATTAIAVTTTFLAKSLARRKNLAAHPGQRIFAANAHPRVQQFTHSGPIQGFRARLVSTAPERLHYRGIPYAKPLTGKSALLPPERPEPWQDTLDCTQFGAPVPQADPTSGTTLSIFGAPGNAFLNYGTDTDLDQRSALNLNISAPVPEAEKTEASKSESYYQRNRHTRTLLPVVVWIHGGANKQGSNCESGVFLDSHAFGDANVISVSVNYRLGLLGFGHLTSPNEHNHSQNLGLKDLHLSLEWIQKNILNFGGDPSNVTLVGQSAGAVNIAALLASPLAPNTLFHKAVLASGGSNDLPLPIYDELVKPGLFQMNVDGGGLAAHATADDVLSNSTDEPTPLLLEGLEYGETGGGGLTASDYVSTASIDLLLEERGVGMSPSLWCHVSGVGGEGDVLPHPVLASIKHGSAQGVPLLLGSMSDEYPGFLRSLAVGKGLPPKIAQSAVTEIFRRGGIGSLKLEAMLRHALHDYRGQKSDQELKSVLDKLRTKLSADVAQSPEEITSRLVNLLATAPANALAAAQASTGSAVYKYEIDLDALDSPIGGNFHGLDLILLFCRPMFYTQEEHHMMSELIFGRASFGEGIDGASDAWCSAIVEFATNGTPEQGGKEGLWAAPLAKDGSGEATVIGSKGKITKSSGGRFYFG